MSNTAHPAAGASMWETDCIHCDGIRADALLKEGDFLAAIQSRMIVCPECGNKRCPKATHHDNDCTGSNEPGQAGSVYAARL